MHDMKFLNLEGLQHFYDKYIRPLRDAAYKDVANDLITTEEGSVLDARQGKALEDKKVDKSNIVNSLLTTIAGYALDARQGKILDERINEINTYLPEIYNDGLDYCIRFPKINIQICFGTLTAKATLGQNGSGYTGTANINHKFVKPFSALASSEVGNASQDWFWIANKTMSNEAIQSIVIGYFEKYTNRSFYVDYIAIGTYSE